MADAPPALAGAVTGESVNSLTPQLRAGSPAPVQDFIASAFAALPPIFLVSVPLVAAALVLCLFIRGVPLSTTARVEAAEEGGAG